MDAPGRELAEYRYRMNKKRHQLIRKTMENLLANIDDLLGELRPVAESAES